MNEMADYNAQRSMTLMLYILYMVAIFSAGILAVVALVINYVKLNEVQGSIFESHFRWQIRTFWWYLFWNIVAFAPFFLLIFTGDNGSLFAGVALSSTAFCIAAIGLSWLWIIYRGIRGLIALNNNEAVG